MGFNNKVVSCQTGYCSKPFNFQYQVSCNHQFQCCLFHFPLQTMYFNDNILATIISRSLDLLSRMCGPRLVGLVWYVLLALQLCRTVQTDPSFRALYRIKSCVTSLFLQSSFKVRFRNNCQEFVPFLRNFLENGKLRTYVIPFCDFWSNTFINLILGNLKALLSINKYVAPKFTKRNDICS